jgi:hypothetical protein
MDGVKADNCHRPSGPTGMELYRNYSRALNETGHPMEFLTCNWGDEDSVDWAGQIAQQYRVQVGR